MLRSIRFSEADRILHVYTLERGRIGAIAKGVRKTKSRFGARLEPLSHVELMLHEGSGELQTVTGAALIRSHHEARDEPYRLEIGLIGAEAMLRLFVEPEANANGVHRADALPRRARRCSRLGGRTAAPRSARARVPAQAAVGVRLSPARDELRRVRRRGRSSASRRAPAAPCAAEHARGSLALSAGRARGHRAATLGAARGRASRSS